MCSVATIWDLAFVDREQQPSATPTPTEPPWASLPHDLVLLVASPLLAQDWLDYARFRCVCAQWRSATDSPRGRGVTDRRFHPRRWMMFPEGRGLYPGHPDLGDYIRFFNLDSGVFVRARLPLFQDHCVLDSISGLPVLQRDEDTAIRLLNPFTGDIVELPPLKTLAHVMSVSNFRSVSTSATFLSEGITVMLAFNSTLVYAASATPQDERWTMVSWMAPIPQAYGQIQDRLYVASHVTLQGSDINIYEMGAHLLDGPKLITVCPKEILCSTLYLVECDSEIIVIGHTDAYRSSLLAYKLADIALGVYTPITSIGDNTIFLGERTLCVSSKALPTVVGDSIVYYRSRPRCFGQYDLGSGTWSQPFDECSLNGIEHGPCSLIRHVLTCCHRGNWSKGTMYTWDLNSSSKWKVKVEFREGA